MYHPYQRALARLRLGDVRHGGRHDDDDDNDDDNDDGGHYYDMG